MQGKHGKLINNFLRHGWHIDNKKLSNDQSNRILRQRFTTYGKNKGESVGSLVGQNGAMNITGKVLRV